MNKSKYRNVTVTEVNSNSKQTVIVMNEIKLTTVNSLPIAVKRKRNWFYIFF